MFANIFFQVYIPEHVTCNDVSSKTLGKSNQIFLLTKANLPSFTPALTKYSTNVIIDYIYFDNIVSVTRAT